MSYFHDNIIKSYMVDLENGVICMDTVYYYGETEESTVFDVNEGETLTSGERVMSEAFVYGG